MLREEIDLLQYLKQVCTPDYTFLMSAITDQYMSAFTSLYNLGYFEDAAQNSFRFTPLGLAQLRLVAESEELSQSTQQLTEAEQLFQQKLLTIQQDLAHTLTEYRTHAARDQHRMADALERTQNDLSEFRRMYNQQRLQDEEQHRREKRGEWIRYIITTAIAVAALFT